MSGGRGVYYTNVHIGLCPSFSGVGYAWTRTSIAVTGRYLLPLANG